MVSTHLDQPYRGRTCHALTQRTERAVKLITESTAAVSGTDLQHGYSHSEVAYRRRCRERSGGIT